MPGLHAKKIVVPIDYSDLCWEAFERAAEIAGPEGEVHVVHVLAPLMAMEPGVRYGTITDETRIQSSEAFLRERLAERKADAKGVAVLIGDAGRQITDYARRVSADMIVISSHGRGFVKQLLLGSVADRVLRLASCPVLVLKS